MGPVKEKKAEKEFGQKKAVSYTHLDVYKRQLMNSVTN